MDPRVGVTPDGHLFYHELTDVEAIFDVEVRLEDDPDEYERLIENVDVVEGTDRWDDLRDMVAGKAPSSNGWMLLLELRRFFGMP
jgi:hypothetical protein